MIRPVLLAALLALPVAAKADGIAFSLSGGAGVAPTYPGSDDYEGVPVLGFSLHALDLGPVSFGDPDPLYRPQGFGLMGSFRYVPGREASDGAALAGTDDVDATVELGAGLRYGAEHWSAFAVLRHGIGGHDSLVGEVGADAHYRPSENWTFNIGPRVLIGSDDYVDEYFGVTAAEAAAAPGGPAAAYDPSGGVVSAGVEIGAGYALGGGWGVNANLRYERLTGDAADSPLVSSEDQVRASIGLTRRFTFGF